MGERKGRETRRSERAADPAAGEMVQKRDAFLQTFFKRGAELTEELVDDNLRLQEQMAKLEEENASLKTQLASDRAIVDLLAKIEDLEREKARLLSTVHEQSEISNRFAEIETELESFANLYVASFQLHASRHLRTVLKNVKELLAQLVGASSSGVYFVDDAERALVPIASDGVALDSLPVIKLEDALGSTPEAIVERTFLTGIPHVTEGDVSASPAACVPLQIENRFVGAIVVYRLLDHKKRFVPVDRELLKLLGAQAGGAILSAQSWEQTAGKMPKPAMLRAAGA